MQIQEGRILGEIACSRLTKKCVCEVRHTRAPYNKNKKKSWSNVPHLYGHLHFFNCYQCGNTGRDSFGEKNLGLGGFQELKCPLTLGSGMKSLPRVGATRRIFIARFRSRSQVCVHRVMQTPKFEKFRRTAELWVGGGAHGTLFEAYGGSLGSYGHILFN